MKIDSRLMLNGDTYLLPKYTPAEMYRLIPRHARKRFEIFAQCFGISRKDIARYRKISESSTKFARFEDND